MTEEHEIIPRPIFDIDTTDFAERRKEAIRRLLSASTPPEYVKNRPMRGGGTANYVDIGYMSEQANLLTYHRWQDEILKEEIRCNDKDEPVEIGVLIKVTVWGASGFPCSHEQWGQKDVARYKYNDKGGAYKAGDIISLFDDKKAAISDGVKKCLSYFGIAADIYAGKELEYFETDSPESETRPVVGTQAMQAFTRFLKDKGILVSDALGILEVESLDKIEDFAEAHRKIKEAKEIK